MNAVALQPDESSAHGLYCDVLQFLGIHSAQGAALKRYLRTAQSCGSEFYTGMAASSRAAWSLRDLQMAHPALEHLTSSDASAAKHQATVAEVSELLRQAGSALRGAQQQGRPFVET